MYRTGQIDAGPWHNWAVRQQDLESMKQSHAHLHYLDWLSNVTTGIYLRTDQPPFNDVRVRRAISHAIDRQAIIEAVFVKGEPTPAISRGVPEWSPRIDELGQGPRLSVRPKGSQTPTRRGRLSQGVENAVQCH